MATRFRLPASGTAERAPAVQSYTHTGSTVVPLLTSDSTALATVTLAPDAADHISAGDTFFKQFVSKSMDGGIVFSNAAVIKCALQCLEPDAGNNLFLQLYVAIVSDDGLTTKRVLRSKVADNTEVATTLTNRILSTTQDGATYTTDPGDRLVVELSLSGTPVAAAGTQGHNGSIRFGSNGAGGDLAEDDTSTGTTLNPWIEFVPTITVTNGDTIDAGQQAGAAHIVPAPRLNPWVAMVPFAINLLINTLQPTPPPRQADWPLPAPRWQLAIDVETRPVDDDLRRRPGALLDWPIPAAKPWAIGLRGWTPAVPPFLLAAPLLPVDWPVPPPRWQLAIDIETRPVDDDQRRRPRVLLDWPNPRRATVAPWTWTQNLLESTVAPVPVPVVPMEWPLPRPVPRLRELAYTDASAVWLLRDQVYGDAGQAPAYDWPNPRRATVAPWTWTQNLLESTVAPVPVPVVPMEWPLPARRRPTVDPPPTRSIALDSPATAAPFTATTWPTQCPRVVSPPWAAPNLSLTTLAPASAVPFAATAWPLPSRSATGTTRTEGATRALVLDVVAAAPLAPIAWVLPRASGREPTLTLGRETTGTPIALITFLPYRLVYIMKT